MTRVISVANQKGGVGKTTTAVNLAVCLARAGHPSLLLDLDPQGNATSALGLAPLEQHPLLEAVVAEECVRPAGSESLSVLPGSRHLVRAESLGQPLQPNGKKPASGRQGELEPLRRLLGRFEFVLFDCPPSLGFLTQAALSLSTEVLVPIQCEYFAMEGLSQIVGLIQQTRSVLGRPPAIGGILLTMFDPALELTHDVAEEVRQHFGPGVFGTVIPRDVALSEAPSHGLSVLDYAPRARGTRAYVELCMEVMDRG